MICTAPCFPPCTREATYELLNHKDKFHLGFNCDEHIAPLRFEAGVVNGNSFQAEYRKKSLLPPPPVVEEPAA